MKKLFTAVLLLVSVSAFAQGGTKCLVTNNSACTTYVYLIVSVPSSTPTCTAGAATTVIAVAPGTSTMYFSNSLPGVSPNANRYFLGAKIDDGTGSCLFTSTDVGESCIGLSATNSLAVKDASCNACATLNFAWGLTSGISTLDF